MTIYEILDLLSQAIHNSTVANGKFIPDAKVGITLTEAQAIYDLIQKEIDVRKRRASAGGKGFNSTARQEAWKAAQAKGVAARQAKALAKKTATKEGI